MLTPCLRAELQLLGFNRGFTQSSGLVTNDFCVYQGIGADVYVTAMTKNSEGEETNKVTTIRVSAWNQWEMLSCQFFKPDQHKDIVAYAIATKEHYS